MPGSDRENTIRHLVQMMSIRETQEESCDSCEQMDAQLRSFVEQQLQLGERLQLLELVLDQDTRGTWVATKQTTARCAIATYLVSNPLSDISIFLSIYLSISNFRSKPGHRDSSKRAESAAASAIGSCG